MKKQPTEPSIPIEPKPVPKPIPYPKPIPLPPYKPPLYDLFYRINELIIQRANKTQQQTAINQAISELEEDYINKLLSYLKAEIDSTIEEKREILKLLINNKYV